MSYTCSNWTGQSQAADGACDNTETCVEIRSDQAPVLRQPREASTGHEMCEKTARAAHQRRGGWQTHALPVGTVFFSAEAGRVAQLHFCFC